MSSQPFAFGSCSRQNKDQSYWNTIASYNPKGFLWIGDAVYSPNSTVAGLDYALSNFTANEHYTAFRNKVDVIDGIWDDHDYGVNDAGRNIVGRTERQDLFMDFLFNNNPSHHFLRSQDGLYHSRDIILGASSSVKLIFLDTRSHRDAPFIRSIGEVQLPLTPLIAASLRVSYSLLGFGRSFDGDILGVSQWEWLRQTLDESTADFNIIVSSIQILTSNPTVESWGHFPFAKRKLLDLIADTDPSGFAFLSGDVHHGEISEGIFERADGTQSKFIEITSSGLTHSCNSGRLTRLLCPLMLNTFSDHRKKKEDFFMGENFGLLSIINNNKHTSSSSDDDDDNNQNSDGLLLDISVLGIRDKAVVLSYQVHKHAAVGSGMRSPIVKVVAPDFPLAQVEVTLIIFTALLIISILRKFCLEKKKKEE